MQSRFSTGNSSLDESLGGGLLPGTLTMVIGATGVGKTQLAMAFRQAGLVQEGQGGAVIDLSSRGDSQNHDGYGQRMFGTALTTADPRRDELPDPFKHGGLKMSCPSWVTAAAACCAARWTSTSGTRGSLS